MGLFPHPVSRSSMPSDLAIVIIYSFVSAICYNLPVEETSFRRRRDLQPHPSPETERTPLGKLGRFFGRCIACFMLAKNLIKQGKHRSAGNVCSPALAVASEPACSASV